MFTLNSDKDHFSSNTKEPLGPVYTKCQRQRYDDACDFVLIENSGVT